MPFRAGSPVFTGVAVRSLASINESSPLIQHGGKNEKKTEINSNERCKAMLFIFLSTPIWAALAVAIKIYPLPVVELLWMRYFVQWIISLVCMYCIKYDHVKVKNFIKGDNLMDLMWGPKLSSEKTKHPIRWIVVTRAVTDFLSICSFYFAISFIPVGDAASVFFLYNMIVFLGAYFLFGDPLGFIGVFNCIISVIGVFLTTQPNFIFGSNNEDDFNGVTTTDQVLGMLFGFVGAIFLTISLLGIRYSKEVHWIQMEQVAGALNSCVTAPIVLGFHLFGAYLAGTPIEEVFIVFGWRDYLFAIFLGILGYAALCLMVQGYQGVESGPGALIAYIELPLTYIFQWLILGAAPNWITWVGVVLIIFSAICQTIWTTQGNIIRQKYLAYLE